MAQIIEKPGIMLYFDVIAPLAKHLEDNEFGELIRCALEYSMTGEEPDIDVFSPVSMAWDILMPHLDRDTERLAFYAVVFCSFESVNVGL